MPRALYVHLNRDDTQTVEPESKTFSTSGPFSIMLENHGKPAHVHLRLDDELAEIAEPDELNPYVPGGEVTIVRVSVADDAVGEGKLDIVTGYGAVSESVTVVCEEASTEPAVVTAPSSEEETTESVELRRFLMPSLFAAIGVLIAVGLMLVSVTAAILVGGVALLVVISVIGYYFTASPD